MWRSVLTFQALYRRESHPGGARVWPRETKLRRKVVSLEDGATSCAIELHTESGQLRIAH